MKFAVLIAVLTGVLFGDVSWGGAADADVPTNSFVGTFCLDCHGPDSQEAGLNLQTIDASGIGQNTAAWEKVVRKLRARQMPPVDARRPVDAEYVAAIAKLESELDRLAQRRPRPGRTETFRRLTRTEYQNAIRDLLAIEIDASTLLPVDQLSHGFDNVTVGELSPTLLNRYVSAAEKISRLAVGRSGRGAAADVFRVRPDITQDVHQPGLPIGTRGGTLINYTFPLDGEYEVQVRLTRDRNEEVEGLRGQHQLEVLLDRTRIELFSISPPKGRDFSKVDAHLTTRLHATAGPHKVAVTFPAQSSALLETLRQPYQARFNMHRHPRSSPAVFQVSITGPFRSEGSGDTPSRRRLFVATPAGPGDEPGCAKRILGTLARRAWRRPMHDSDLSRALTFFEEGREADGFDAGIEAAVASILVNPQFLFRIERDPSDVPAGDVYQVSDLDLASRLSFFLWSSLPDDELLALAERGELSQPEVLRQQTRRMLKDDRSQSLVNNFAAQWLYLRNLESITPDMRLFPDFDDNLRQAMRTETELFFGSVMREDRSVLDLLHANYTFLNGRLAKHYGIAGVYGSRFRRLSFGQDRQRGGLLRHGSILTVTSYATRTSPVIRGQWILKNLLGTPAPPPPDDVPALKDNSVAANLPLRQRLAQHRADPNCAGCHNLMDPPGFSLENFDAIGRWRELESGHTVDANGGLPDGSQFEGVAGLERALLQRPELFAGTLTEKLLTYALGRGVTEDDAPAIRKIVRQASENDYHFSSLILGIVESVPFQMRTAE